MTFDPTATFDRAESAIGRVLDHGRAFVGSGKVAEMVQEMANDAEVEIHVRPAQGRGWWVTLWTVTLLLIGAGQSNAQLPARWQPVLSAPFVLDTLTVLVGHSIVFRAGPVAGAIAQHMHNDTIKLGAYPDSASPEYVLAHEVGHMWSEEHRADSAVVNILLTHDAQEQIGGYAAKSTGEHAAEAFAYAVLILRLPEQEQSATLDRVEPLVLGTSAIYYQLRAQLAHAISAR